MKLLKCHFKLKPICFNWLIYLYSWCNFQKWADSLTVHFFFHQGSNWWDFIQQQVDIFAMHSFFLMIWTTYRVGILFIISYQLKKTAKLFSVQSGIPFISFFLHSISMLLIYCSFYLPYFINLKNLLKF